MEWIQTDLQNTILLYFINPNPHLVMSKRQTKPQGEIHAQLDDRRSIRGDTCRSTSYVQGGRGPRLKEEQVVEEHMREVEEHMRRWGINPAQDASHKAFWTQTKSIVSDFVRGQGQMELEPLEPEELPQDDRVSAIMLFLVVEIAAMAAAVLVKTRDLLKECHPGLPFCPPFGSDKKKVRAYRHIATRELDPLLRFVEERDGQDL